MGVGEEGGSVLREMEGCRLVTWGRQSGEENRAGYMDEVERGQGYAERMGCEANPGAHLRVPSAEE